MNYKALQKFTALSQFCPINSLNSAPPPFASTLDHKKPSIIYSSYGKPLDFFSHDRYTTKTRNYTTIHNRTRFKPRTNQQDYGILSNIFGKRSSPGPVSMHCEVTIDDDGKKTFKFAEVDFDKFVAGLKAKKGFSKKTVDSCHLLLKEAVGNGVKKSADPCPLQLKQSRTKMAAKNVDAFCKEEGGFSSDCILGPVKNKKKDAAKGKYEYDHASHHEEAIACLKLKNEEYKKKYDKEMDKIYSNMKEYSDLYFKAKSLKKEDKLKEGMVAKNVDSSFKEDSILGPVKNKKKDTAKGKYEFDHASHHEEAIACLKLKNEEYKKKYDKEMDKIHSNMKEYNDLYFKSKSLKKEDKSKGCMVPKNVDSFCKKDSILGPVKNKKKDTAKAKYDFDHASHHEEAVACLKLKDEEYKKKYDKEMDKIHSNMKEYNDLYFKSKSLKKEDKLKECTVAKNVDSICKKEGGSSSDSTLGPVENKKKDTAKGKYEFDHASHHEEAIACLKLKDEEYKKKYDKEMDKIYSNMKEYSHLYFKAKSLKKEDKLKKTDKCGLSSKSGISKCDEKSDKQDKGRMVDIDCGNSKCESLKKIEKEDECVEKKKVKDPCKEDKPVKKEKCEEEKKVKDPCKEDKPVEKNKCEEEKKDPCKEDKPSKKDNFAKVDDATIKTAANPLADMDLCDFPKKCPKPKSFVATICDQLNQQCTNLACQANQKRKDMKEMSPENVCKEKESKDEQVCPIKEADKNICEESTPKQNVCEAKEAKTCATASDPCSKSDKKGDENVCKKADSKDEQVCPLKKADENIFKDASSKQKKNDDSTNVNIFTALSDPLVKIESVKKVEENICKAATPKQNVCEATEPCKEKETKICATASHPCSQAEKKGEEYVCKKAECKDEQVCPLKKADENIFKDATSKQKAKDDSSNVNIFTALSDPLVKIEPDKKVDENICMKLDYKCEQFSPFKKDENICKEGTTKQNVCEAKETKTCATASDPCAQADKKGDQNVCKKAESKDEQVCPLKKADENICKEATTKQSVCESVDPCKANVCETVDPCKENESKIAIACTAALDPCPMIEPGKKVDENICPKFDYKCPSNSVKVDPCKEDVCEAGDPCKENVSENVHPCKEDVREAGDPCKENVGEKVDPCKENICKAVDPCKENVGEKVDPCKENICKAVDPCKENVGEKVDPCKENICKAVDPCKENVGEKVDPCKENICKAVDPCKENVCEKVDPCKENAPKIADTCTATCEKFEADADQQPCKQYSEPCASSNQSSIGTTPCQSNQCKTNEDTTNPNTINISCTSPTSNSVPAAPCPRTNEKCNNETAADNKCQVENVESNNNMISCMIQIKLSANLNNPKPIEFVCPLKDPCTKSEKSDPCVEEEVTTCANQIKCPVPCEEPCIELEKKDPCVEEATTCANQIQCPVPCEEPCIESEKKDPCPCIEVCDPCNKEEITEPKCDIATMEDPTSFIDIVKICAAKKRCDESNKCKIDNVKPKNCEYACEWEDPKSDNLPIGESCCATKQPDDPLVSKRCKKYEVCEDPQVIPKPTTCAPYPIPIVKPVEQNCCKKKPKCVFDPCSRKPLDLTCCTPPEVKPEFTKECYGSCAPPIPETKPKTPCQFEPKVGKVMGPPNDPCGPPRVKVLVAERDAPQPPVKCNQHVEPKEPKCNMESVKAPKLNPPEYKVGSPGARSTAWRPVTIKGDREECDGRKEKGQTLKSPNLTKKLPKIETEDTKSFLQGSLGLFKTMIASIAPGKKDNTKKQLKAAAAPTPSLPPTQYLYQLPVTSNDGRIIRSKEQWDFLLNEKKKESTLDDVLNQPKKSSKESTNYVCDPSACECVQKKGSCDCNAPK